MTQTRRGTEDGYTIRQYHRGETYDVRRSLAAQFLNRGWAYNAEPFEPAEPESVFDALGRANADFDRLFRPRTCRPTNPATPAVGEQL